jgi:hypothetical protein
LSERAYVVDRLAFNFSYLVPELKARHLGGIIRIDAAYFITGTKRHP